MRIALGQIDVRIADFPAIARQLLDVAARARDDGADLLCLPEMACIGYPPRDLLDRRHLVQRQWELVHELAADFPLPTIVGCIEPIADGGWPRLANAAAVIDGGRVVATYRKRLLPTYDVFDEHRYFRPGTEPLVVELAGKRVAVSICEDIWSREFLGFDYGVDPVAEVAGRCDLLVNIAASPYHCGKPELRRRLLEDCAERVAAPVVYVNHLGAHDELLFDGGSKVVRPGGRWCGVAPRWREALLTVDCDDEVAKPPVPDPDEDLYQGLSFGIAGYCGKTGQQRVVLGLSGGIDSAVTAALAVDALGSERVIGLLMPGPYSSDHSIHDAEALADALGIARFTCDIGEANRAVLRALAEPFAGTEAGVAEENIQARLRGLLVMAYGNKFGAMALTTGNKSEIAVGYCTLYGDMNGGLAPLGDVYKTRVYNLANVANATGERIPRSTIQKEPSAELRPDQRDADSLPPYPVLDRILQHFLESDHSVADLVAAGDDETVVRRVIRLVEVNEYKRRQAAPCLRVTSKAFGVGRRLPLARGLD